MENLNQSNLNYSIVKIDCSANPFASRYAFADLEPQQLKIITKIEYGASSAFYDTFENILVTFDFSRDVPGQEVAVCSLELFAFKEQTCTEMLCDYFHRVSEEPDPHNLRLLIFLGGGEEDRFNFIYKEFMENCFNSVMPQFMQKQACRSYAESLIRFMYAYPLHQVREYQQDSFNLTVNSKMRFDTIVDKLLIQANVFTDESEKKIIHSIMLDFLLASCSPHFKELSQVVLKEQIINLLDIIPHASIKFPMLSHGYKSSNNQDSLSMRALIVFIRTGDNQENCFKKMINLNHDCKLGNHYAKNGHPRFFTTIEHTEFDCLYEGPLIQLVLECLKSRSPTYSSFAKVRVMPTASHFGTLIVEADSESIDYVGKKIVSFLQRGCKQGDLPHSYAFLMSFKLLWARTSHTKEGAAMQKPLPSLSPEQQVFISKTDIFPTSNSVIIHSAYKGCHEPNFRTEAEIYELELRPLFIGYFKPAKHMKFLELYYSDLKKERPQAAQANRVPPLSILGKRSSREEEEDKRPEPERRQLRSANANANASENAAANQNQPQIVSSQKSHEDFRDDNPEVQKRQNPNKRSK